MPASAKHTANLDTPMTSTPKSSSYSVSMAGVVAHAAMPATKLRRVPLSKTSAPGQRLKRPRPFLKWAGGKGQLLAEILAQLPPLAARQRYHEPFLGGGAVFFGLGPGKATLSDVNGELITTYTAIRDQLSSVLQALREHRVCQDHYYRVRAQQTTDLTPAQVAARMIYLNRTCFNGLYRVNRRGEFNVPFGRHNNPTICDVDNLTRVARALKNVSLRHESVFSIGRRVRLGDVVYFDPPYDPVSRTASFTSYTQGGFGPDEQAQLATLFTRLANRGVRVVLSNSDTPYIRDLYKCFRIHTVQARRAINRCAEGRAAVNEVLVTVD